ncbi:unnamed protein product [Effrenium voratum]|nr:unnamed protein product [Effrenium voratum]|mmetsp:Transcript_14086/g.33554  ORF Transcript_14086/g.33554 Transcript_14086/m.33554 type:complete len:224 (+) Transcript_14086:66-737(+)|eukprot:CAMPEP_0181423286 /NCGR_PEP_ID=MMETSP1110-20121109/14050_1 /TAXON_ID=174948 /ORGANISM="Symbiodinium sp., Strain CCMP421" /LENGTH=223 /DNA_ID=CAMNT_0023546407 /DNA_START=52 /DNA_END=723 /DNA_ORIENTATION=-
MARSLAVAALIAVAGGLAFVPGAIPRGTTAPPSRALQAAPAAESSWGSLPTLVGGMALGVFFSLATLAPVRAEEAPATPAPTPAEQAPTPAPGPSDEEILAKGCDIRVDCTTKEQQFAWAKAYYRKYNQETDGKDPKYSKPSTGAGVFRKFKIDWPNPDPSIPDTTDGTYPIRNEDFLPIWKQQQEDLRAKMKEYIGREFTEIRWIEDYDNAGSPYKPHNGYY